MSRWLILSVIILAACGGSSDADDGPEAAMEQYIDLVMKQQGGRVYDMIVPEQAERIDRDLFIGCIQDGDAPSVEADATESYTETLDVPEIGDVETWAVTVELSANGQSDHVTRHLIERDGDYYVFYDAADLETYASGECP